MPTETMRTNNTSFQWFPPSITAWLALKISEIILIVISSTTVTANVAIGIDEIADISTNLQKSKSQIVFRIATAGVETHIVDLSSIVGEKLMVGDFIDLITSASTLEVSAIIKYEMVKTSFDQYGQVSKTFKRLLSGKGT